MKEPTKIARRQAREERLRSALRANLKRRKAQMRGRGPDARETPPAETDGPAGTGEKNGSGTS